MPKQRMKKLFVDEKCGICYRRAQGIKYNAISCDSCRVFFRRLVMVKDNCAKSNRLFELPCMRAHLIHKTPSLSEIELLLKCQHCRFLKCVEAGMNDKFVQGSIAYEDNRTSRRTVKGSGSRSPLSSNGSPSSAVCQTNGPDTFFQELANNLDMDPVPIVDTLKAQRNHLINIVNSFWKSYCHHQDTRTSGQTSSQWIVPQDSVAKLQCVDHIRDALYLHVHKLTELLNLLPFMADMFSTKKKTMIVMQCYTEIIVLRWAATTKFDEHGQSIRGLTGIEYKFDDMCKFGASWTAKFKEYFQISQQIIKANPDELDLSFMAALILLTSDRHNDLTDQQNRLICSYQEFFGAMLWEKCRSENNRRKFYKLMNGVINLRSTIRDVDVSQVTGYRRRIILTNDVTITVP